jgi:hypothetical protein
VATRAILGGVFAGVFSWAFLVCGQPAFAASVTKLSDSGEGSLRQSIADTAPGGKIDFTIKGVIKLTSGELTIDKDLVITGPGTGNLSISGSNGSRVFNITGGDVTISGLTVCDGKTTGSPARGGGIYNNGKLTLRSVAVKGNQAEGAAGQCAYGAGIYNNSTMTVMNCTISGNTAQGGEGTAGGNGARGGGICTVGSMTVSASTIAGNTAAGGTSTGPGRAGDGEGGGIFCYNNCTVAVDGTTISGNKARAGNSSHESGQAGFASGGGAIQNWGGASGTRTYTNCTFSQDVCEGGVGGMADSCSRGGGVWETSTATFIHCTFFGNKTNGKFQEGGGLYSAANAGEGPVVQNCIFVGNASMSGPDLRGNIRSQDFNLIGDATGCTLTGAVAQNIAGKDPKLGPLADNGGPNQTHAVQPGSPAVDCIPVANCPLKTDQRGVVRPMGEKADIGAFEADTVPPKVTAIAAVTPNPTNSKLVSFGVKFDEDVRSFDAPADVVLQETGTVSHTGAAVKGGPRDYTVDVTGVKGNGTISLAVNTKSDVQDMSGNALATSPAGAPLTIDNLPPTATAIAPTTPNPTNADKVAFSVNFSENVQKFDAVTDVIVTKSEGLSYGGVAISGGPQNYTVDVTGVSGNGTLALALNQKSDVCDIAGNPVTATVTSPVVTVDHTPPTATITPATPSPTNADAVEFAVSFSEPVGTSFAVENLALTGTLAAAATSQVGGTDPNYKVTVKPSDPNANGNIAMSISPNVKDIAGNALAPTGPSPAIAIDNAPPTVTIAPAAPGPTNADSMAFTVTFSEPVAPTFTIEDIALTGTLASAAKSQLSGEDPSYTTTVTPNDPNADGTLGIVVGPAITDKAGNALPAPVRSPLVTFDNAPPTVSIECATPNPTNADTIAFNVKFSEPVAPTFTIEDVVLAGTLAAAAKTQVGGTDPSYTVSVTPSDPNADGTIGIVLKQDVADVAGNKLKADVAGPVVTLDNKPGTVTITPTTPPITNADAVVYKVELSKPLAKALSPDAIVVAGSLAGAVTKEVAGQDNAYTVTVKPTDPKASGTLSISLGPGVTDPAGNPVTIPAPPPVITVDKTPPTLTITPVTPSPTRSDAVAFNLVFSKPVAPTFAVEDVTLAGTLASAATFQLAGSDPGYTVVVTPNDPNASGTVGIVVGTGVADVAGNALAAAVTGPTVAVDKTPPTAKIDLVTTNAAGAATLVFAVTFSEPVAPTFNNNNLALAGTLASAATAQISGADPAYSVTVSLTDPKAGGTLGIVIGAGVSDAAGNAYAGAASELYKK